MNKAELKQAISEIENKQTGSLSNIQLAFVDACITILNFMYSANLNEIPISKFNELCGGSEISELVRSEFGRNKIGYFSPGFQGVFRLERENCMQALTYYLKIEGSYK